MVLAFASFLASVACVFSSNPEFKYFFIIGLQFLILIEIIDKKK